MKTKLFTLLFALLLASGAFAEAYLVVPIGDLYYKLDATTRTAEVTEAWYSQLSGAVVIPSSVTYDNVQYSVTSIGNYVFRDCTGLTSITIPESVTSIGNYAFRGCTGLTAITIPESVTSIGESAFGGCTGLTSITIPESVTSIGYDAFDGCTGLTSITIPESVTSIGSTAFDGCTGLTSIVWNARNCSDTGAFNQIAPQIVSFTFGSNVETIPSGLCSGMSKLTSITIPEGVTSIGSAFYGCSGLTSITIPESVTSIENGVFATCSGMTSITVAADNTVYDSRNNCNAIIETATNKLIAGCKNTVIPNSVTSIEYSAFRECLGLTSITIPNSVTYIGESAFEGCTDLTSITIPNSVTYIGEYAFYGCTDLTSVTLGSSLKVIEYGGFAYCENLQTITCYSQRPPTVQEGGLEDVPYSTIIYVPADYLDTYKQHVTWGSYDVRPIDGSAVENVTLQGMRVEAGMLVFGEPAEVSVYTVAGVCVHSGMTERLQLPSGVYTVRCGNAACKTLIP